MLDDPLHDTEVVQDRHQRREDDDRREHLGEEEEPRGALGARAQRERAEDEAGPVGHVPEEDDEEAGEPREALRGPSQRRERLAHRRPLEDDDGEEEERGRRGRDGARPGLSLSSSLKTQGIAVGEIKVKEEKDMETS